MSTLTFIQVMPSLLGFIILPILDISLFREGVATVIHESAEQLPEKPSVVVVSVGGGGLMSGVLQGMHNVGWVDVPLIAMETKGADSFDAAVQAGELVTLDAITRFVWKPSNPKMDKRNVFLK